MRQSSQSKQTFKLRISQSNKNLLSPTYLFYCSYIYIHWYTQHAKFLNFVISHSEICHLIKSRLTEYPKYIVEPVSFKGSSFQGFQVFCLTLKFLSLQNSRTDNVIIIVSLLSQFSSYNIFMHIYMIISIECLHSQQLISAWL